MRTRPRAACTRSSPSADRSTCVENIISTRSVTISRRRRTVRTSLRLDRAASGALTLRQRRRRVSLSTHLRTLRRGGRGKHKEGCKLYGVCGDAVDKDEEKQPCFLYFMKSMVGIREFEKGVTRRKREGFVRKKGRVDTGYHVCGTCGKKNVSPYNADGHDASCRMRTISRRRPYAQSENQTIVEGFRRRNRARSRR